MKVKHTTAVPGPADQVHELVADVRWWPLLFENIVHVEVMEQAGDSDRLRLWAVDVDAAFETAASAGRDAAPASGIVRSWTARRTFRRTPVLAIAFRQEEPQHPLLSMGGVWEFRATPGTDTCEVHLTHEAAADGGADRHPWIRPMVQAAARSQLEGLSTAAQLPHGTARALAELSGTVTIRTGSVYPDGLLPGLHTLPSLSGALRVPVADDVFLAVLPGRRDLRLAVCLSLPGGRVVTKRLRPPAAVLALTDEWTVTPCTGDTGEVRVGVHRRALLPAVRPGRRGPTRIAERVRNCLAADIGDSLQQLTALSTVAA
ncbi:aromatase/cyclase [Streptomyces sp. NPDC021562]|uniref:aromatase/cyclase n=1 Tax=Streptomyces sp. NPDC021562 TaxID=3155121 RepID=UPI0033F9843D